MAENNDLGRQRHGRAAGLTRRGAAMVLVIALLASVGGVIAVGAASADPPPAPVAPAPIPDGLWNETPTGVTGDYVYVKGTAGDPVTQGADLLVDGDVDPFAVADREGSIAMLPPINTMSDFWLFEFFGADPDGLVQPGYYGDLSSRSPGYPGSQGTPGINVRHGRNNEWLCRDETTGWPEMTGWFAVDRVERFEGQIYQLDLRFEQSCNGAPPLHGRIHLDVELPPTTTTSTSTSTTTEPTTTTSTSTTTTSTTSTTAPPTTQPPAEVPLSRPPGSPIGTLDRAEGQPGGVVVAGWAIDPDTKEPIPVHVYVDAAGTALTADRSRPDVSAAFAGYGDRHGFQQTIATAPGTHQVCAYGINTGVGDNTLIACRQVVVPGGPPFGTVDAVSTFPGGVEVAGWAIDPDTIDSIPVHVYVDGIGVALTADRARDDVGAAIPPYGPMHGYVARIAAGPGTHQVCAYGINTGVGDNSTLGCRQVTVPGGSPFGVVDIGRGVPGGIVMAGWAIDPDVSTPIDVHIYVDGVGSATTAAGSRPDVGAAFPGYGDEHGFTTTIPAPPGTHQVCAYGINTGVGDNHLLGCRTAIVP